MEFMQFLVMAIVNLLLAFLAGCFFMNGRMLRHMRKNIQKKTGSMIDDWKEERSQLVAGRLEVMHEMLDFFNPPFRKNKN